MVQIHKNYAQAALLMIIAYAITGISLVKSFLSIFTIDSTFEKIFGVLGPEYTAMMSEKVKSAVMVSIILTSLFYLTAIYFIRKGYVWMKYVMLIISLWNVYKFATTNIFSDTVETIVIVTATALEIWTTILLFKAPIIDQITTDVDVKPDMT